jgi:hypothetical protein
MGQQLLLLLPVRFGFLFSQISNIFSAFSLFGPAKTDEKKDAPPGLI